MAGCSSASGESCTDHTFLYSQLLAAEVSVEVVEETEQGSKGRKREQKKQVKRLGLRNFRWWNIWSDVQRSFWKDYTNIEFQTRVVLVGEAGEDDEGPKCDFFFI